MPPTSLTRYDRKGVIRKPSGSTLTGIVPTNTYMCADGKYVVIGGNGDSIYKRLMVTANRVDLANDPRLSTNPGRVTHQAEVDDAIAAWTASLPSMEVSVVDCLLIAFEGGARARLQDRCALSASESAFECL